MNQIFNLLFEQYSSYAVLEIIMEITAVFFGFASVWYSKQNKIWVFPTGMISTAIFVYLLYKWDLLGDMLINGYYFIMSVYGWYIWTRKVDTTHVTPISRTTAKEKKWSDLQIHVEELLQARYEHKEALDKWFHDFAELLDLLNETYQPMGYY